MHGFGDKTKEWSLPLWLGRSTPELGLVDNLTNLVDIQARGYIYKKKKITIILQFFIRREKVRRERKAQNRINGIYDEERKR